MDSFVSNLDFRNSNKNFKIREELLSSCSNLQVSVNPLKVEIDHLKKRDFDRRDDSLRATSMEVVSTLRELLTMHPLYNEQLKSFANVGGDFAEPDRLSDMGASLTSADEDGFQSILEQLSIPDRWGSVKNLPLYEDDL